MFNEFIINKNNLINNIKQVKKNNPHSKLCAMVKANAYGVGLKEVTEISENLVDCFGVACFFEAVQLRELTNKEILIVGAVDYENISTDFSHTCSSLDDIIFFVKQDKEFKIHLKINSGMNRFGFGSLREFKTALRIIKNSKLKLEGVFTHFATADEFVDKQYDIFNKFVKIVKTFGFKPIIHTDNSTVNICKNHNLDMVRIGFDLFNQNGDGFNQVAQIRTQVVQVHNVKKGQHVGYARRFVAQKNTRVAIFPMGYADGFDLRFVGVELFFKGVKCKVLNVCMDCFMLDVGKLDVKKGDELFVLNNVNSLSRYAEFIGVNPYQIMTSFGAVRADKIIN